MTTSKPKLAPRSLRSRLAVLAAVVVVAAIGASMAVAYVVVRHELHGQLDDQLRSQADELQRRAAVFTGPLPVLQLHSEFGRTGGYVQVIDVAGDRARAADQTVSLPVDEADEQVAAGQRAEVFRDGTVGGESVRMLTTGLLPGAAVQIALPTVDIDRELHHLAVAFTALGAAAFAVAVGATWLVTRTALAPVARLTATTERIATTGDLTHRLEPAGADEVGRLASSFNSMLDALEQSNRSQQQLVADASHELRTPLASLRTNAEVLRQFDALPPDQREDLVAGMLGQLDELGGLIGDLVELARGELPGAERAPVRFDELVDDAVVRARRHWPHTTFTVDLAPVTVEAVANRLDRAVANLLDNGAKFAGGAGHVEVQLDASGRLIVRDDGPGVADDALPHVFDRFYRADQARAMPGSGLGLAIVAQVAESHGGTVTMRNQPGGGAVVELQVAPSPHDPQPSTA
jgi:two-component system, OmpR family, sensor histidine kinase MprB